MKPRPLIDDERVAAPPDELSPIGFSLSLHVKECPGMRRYLILLSFAAMILSVGCAPKTRLIEKSTPLPENLGIHSESPSLSVTLTQVVRVRS